jgi:HipA-like protein
MIWGYTLETNKINIFSQTALNRTFVGVLYRKNNTYYLEYDKQYRQQNNAVALGPELELWKEKHSSNNIFPSIADRIPSKQNPAYKDYCRQWGISEDEKDVFKLLTTIGRRGPSTFVFEMAPKDYSPESVKGLRNKLGLTQREFALLFDITQTTLSKIESGKSAYSTILVLIQLCEEVPDALSWLLKIRGQYIHDVKRAKIENMLKNKKI